jgi:hypothetical protein
MASLGQLPLEEQEAIHEAAVETARQTHSLSDVVRLLLIHANRTGRRLSIEGGQRSDLA